MKNKNWFWGIFFILSAVSVIAIQTGSFELIGIQSLLIGAFLVAVIIASLVKLNFFGVFFPMSFLYMIFWQPLGLQYINYWFVVLASVLVSIGFSIIFGSRHHKSWPNCNGKVDYVTQGSESEEIDDDNPNVSVRFGSASKYLHAEHFKTGRFAVSFGELELFFDQVKVDPEGAEIFIDASFGSIILNLPREWKVVDNVHVSLGEVKNKARASSQGEDAPRVTLTGNVQFGGMEVRYV